MLMNQERFPIVAVPTRLPQLENPLGRLLRLLIRHGGKARRALGFENRADTLPVVEPALRLSACLWIGLRETSF
jgi:hypothetical protein